MTTARRSSFVPHTRVDTSLIFDLVPPNCSVLDLGCGDGELLARLIAEKKVQASAVEISHEGILECVARGLDVCQVDIDRGLEDFGDNSFDYVILNQTLQAVHKPDLVIREMLRVGRHGIVGFPNFGNWRIRLQLLLGGRAPRTRSLPFHWYNTPNIRVLTRQDFRDFCEKSGIHILREVNLVPRGGKGSVVRILPNLFAEICVFVIEK